MPRYPFRRSVCPSFERAFTHWQVLDSSCVSDTGVTTDAHSNDTFVTPTDGSMTALQSGHPLGDVQL